MENFIIIKHYIHILGMPNDCGSEYLYITAEPRKDAEPGTPQYKVSYKTLTDAEAREMIQEHGLKLALRNKYGMIWDTPQKDFLSEYGRNIQIQSHIGQ